MRKMLIWSHSHGTAPPAQHHQSPHKKRVEQPVMELWTLHFTTSFFFLPFYTLPLNTDPASTTTSAALHFTLLLLFPLLREHIMKSVIEGFQKRSFLPTMPANQALPVSQGDSKEPCLRRRLSSLSLKIQPIASPAASWAFRRSKSVSSMGEYAGSSIRKWWDWGWSWILSRKPIFATDLEMDEEETKMLGSHNKGSWRHVFYKVRYEIRKLVGSDKVGLPQTYSYDSYNYSQNFEDGVRSTQG